MTGRNTMILNQETMLEALSYWLKDEVARGTVDGHYRYCRAKSIKKRGDKFVVEVDGPLQPKTHAVAQRTEQRPSKPPVAGSTPASVNGG